MKVFMNKRQGDYTGGLLIVAANSAREAHELCLNSDELEDAYWENGYEYETNSRIKMPAYNCYKWDGWQEVPNLEYHGEIPCVIEEEGYAEKDFQTELSEK